MYILTDKNFVFFPQTTFWNFRLCLSRCMFDWCVWRRTWNCVSFPDLMTLSWVVQSGIFDATGGKFRASKSPAGVAELCIAQKQVRNTNVLGVTFGAGWHFCRRYKAPCRRFHIDARAHLSFQISVETFIPPQILAHFTHGWLRDSKYVCSLSVRPLRKTIFPSMLDAFKWITHFVVTLDLFRAKFRLLSR